MFFSAINKFKKNNNSGKSNPFVLQDDLTSSRIAIAGRGLSWEEEALPGRSGEAGIIGKTFNFARAGLLKIIFSLALAILLGRVGYLQVIKGEYYYSMAEGNRIRIDRIEPKRGIIYDRENRPLVRNAANFLLYFIPADLPFDKSERNKIISRINQIIGGLDEREIQSGLDKIKRKSPESFNPFFVADNIEYEKAMVLYLEADRTPGMILSSRTRREYNLICSSLSHVLGYVGKISENELKNNQDYLPIDYIGKSGIEQSWEKELKGESGKKNIEVDALGKEKKTISISQARDGHNLILSIDENLQKEAENVLSASLTKLKLKKGVVVIMDPNNGEVLALVSLPAYDDNLFAHGISAADYSRLIKDEDHPLFNRAIAGEFPAGSTIKPVIAAGALEEGIIDENTTFLSTGGIRVGDWFFPDWKAGGHGATNVRKAIAQSVNTFFYIIGGGYQDFRGLGADKIGQYEKLFGLGKELGIDLPSEAAGFLPTKEWKEKTTGERWYIGNTYNISIGQGDTLVTPLQVAAYTSYFANGGRLLRPHLVSKILSSDDKPVSDVQPQVIGQGFIKDYNIRIVREGMRDAVVYGSARSLSALPVAAAGKTGTAQWSSKHDPHAWFTGFAPYDNPQIAITVLVEEGKEGSTAATPIAKEILAWYFQQKKP